MGKRFALFARKPRAGGLFDGSDPVRLEDVDLPVSVRRNAQARRLILRLARDGGGLVVTAPPFADDATIVGFLRKNRDWIAGRRAAMPAARRVEPGEMLPIRGVETRLEHAPERRRAVFRPNADGSDALNSGAIGEPSLVLGGDLSHFSRRVGDYLKREARRDLQEAVDRHARAVGLRPGGLTLRDTRSRWGSCTADRKLSFSWRIVMAPPFVLDYLAAHEVAHFREMNHGPAFWALCASLCPATEDGRAWLRGYGSQLHRIDFSPYGEP